MILRGFARLTGAMLIAAWVLAPAASRADEAQKTIKIGVIFDLTGPFAGGGSDLQYLGAKIMIDWFNAQGGIDGYKVDAVYADAQSKPDVAINEAVRIEQFHKFMWITTCIASPVLAGRDLHYVFRANPYGQQWGHASTAMVY